MSGGAIVLPSNLRLATQSRIINVLAIDSLCTASWDIIIIIISLFRTHVRRTCLHSKNITMKHTTVIL